MAGSYPVPEQCFGFRQASVKLLGSCLKCTAPLLSNYVTGCLSGLDVLITVPFRVFVLIRRLKFRQVHRIP